MIPVKHQGATFHLPTRMAVQALNDALADPAARAELPLLELAETKRLLRALDTKRWIWKQPKKGS